MTVDGLLRLAGVDQRQEGRRPKSCCWLYLPLRSWAPLSSMFLFCLWGNVLRSRPQVVKRQVGRRWSDCSLGGSPSGEWLERQCFSPLMWGGGHGFGRVCQDIEVMRGRPGILWRAPPCSEAQAVHELLLVAGIRLSFGWVGEQWQEKRKLHQSCPASWVSSDSQVAGSEMVPALVSQSRLPFRRGVVERGSEGEFDRMRRGFAFLLGAMLL